MIIQLPKVCGPVRSLSALKLIRAREKEKGL